jgi:XTP/dITP diphosphohydrolase
VGRVARLASHNANKLRELRSALPGWEVELLDAAELPPEVGETYYENALAKARFGRDAGEAGVWTLGEDSGLEVDALDGGPGHRSARWAGDADPVDRLLEELEDVDEGRSARYVCNLVGVSPAGEEVHVVGVLEGSIARERRGSEGFGYDPVFVPAGETRTVAELGNDWKAGNSHRARAALALGEYVAANPGT